ncbi:serine hydrolase [Deinococcus sp.]|uniref:serine hydrolase n=1 Tax=Deinococcus sp. TaxID=47478 RepID=UPI003CC66F12
MRLSTRPLRRKGRYLLLAAALLSAGLYARTLHPAAPVSADSARMVAGGPAPPNAAKASPEGGCFQAAPAALAPPAPKRLSGRLGLYVAVIDPLTLRPIRAVGHDQDGVYPLASAYKQAVLWALLRQRDAGALRLAETFDVSRAMQSLGDYPFDHSDVLTLATRMIQHSDNTATDLLHRRVGLKAVQDLADGLGLCRTRLILPTKDWWTAQAGLSPSFPGAETFAHLGAEARLRAALALDADAQAQRADQLQHKLDSYFDHSYSAQTDLGTQNVSTPAEFAHLVAAEFLHSGLSQDGQTLQRQLMALGFGGRRIQAKQSYFGGKGGNGWRLLTYSGYFRTAGGEDVVYAFMQHGANQSYTMKNTGAAFLWINAALREVLLSGDGGVVDVPPLAPTPTLSAP